MRRAFLVALCGLTLTAVSAGVHAQNAYTARPANVRAGPDRTYPLVVQLGPGSPVSVMGCLDDWSWCDVAFDDSRGWVYAPSLSYVYDGSRVPLYSYAPGLGIPVVTFSIGAYWGQYYRGRPWFGQLNQWEHRRIPHRRPPGPPPHAGPPPRGGPGRGPVLHGGAPARGMEHMRPGGQPDRGAPARESREGGGPHAAPRERGGRPGEQARPGGHPPSREQAHPDDRSRDQPR